MNIYLENNGYDVEDYINAVAVVLGLDEYEGDLRIDLMKKCDGDAGGYCYGDADDIDIEIATHVQGEALDIETIKVNIAHEMIHAQQIASGRLNDHGIQIVDECLVKVAEWDGEYHTNTPYDDQPWEIDAYGRESDVANQAKEMIAQWM
jgi:4-hydroxy-3-methylbut-2-enyl diphosphate reductase IspH